MRSLAIARFRVLNGIRSCDWVFGVALFWAVAPLAVYILAVFMTGLVLPTSVMQFDGYRAVQMPMMMIVTYSFHLFILYVASDMIPAAVWKVADEKVETTDLFDTVPIDPGSRFLGDAAGIAATLAIVHVATMPVLFLGAAISPLGTGAVLWIEAAVFSQIAFVGFLSAAKLNDFRTPWGRMRPFRTVAAVAVLLVVWIALTARLYSFRDAVGGIIVDPSPRTWAALVETVHNPLLLAMLTAATFAGAVAYLYMHAVRPERSR